MDAFHPIWSLNLGDELVAIKTLATSDKEVLFTVNKSYKVIGAHPLASPPCVVVHDDLGDENKIQPDFLVNFKVAKKEPFLLF